MATEIITGIEALKVNDGISAALSDAFKKLKISVRDSAETPLCKNKGTLIRRPFFRTAIPEQILLPLPLSPSLPLSLTYTCIHTYIHTYMYTYTQTHVQSVFISLSLSIKLPLSLTY